MKHDDMMQRTIVNAEGFLFAIDNRYPKFPLAIAATGTLNPEYVNLMAASGLLYRTARETAEFLEALIIYLETKGLEEAVASVAGIQATLNSAMKIALEGIPKKMHGGEKSS